MSAKKTIISTYFACFNRITTDLVKKSHFINVGFFLVGANFILSEDLSNREYSESALELKTMSILNPTWFLFGMIPLWGQESSWSI